MKKESQRALNSQKTLVQNQVHKHPVPLNTYGTYIQHIRRSYNIIGN